MKAIELEEMAILQEKNRPIRLKRCKVVYSIPEDNSNEAKTLKGIVRLCLLSQRS